MKRVVWMAVLAVAAGCGPAESQGLDEYGEAAPADLDALSLAVSDASTEGALSSEDGVNRQGVAGAAPEFLQLGRERVQQLNAAMKTLTAPVAELIQSGAGTKPVGTTRVFGPKDIGGVTYQLTIKKFAEKRFGWLLEGKQPSQGTFQKLAVGALTRLAGVSKGHRGRGVVAVDFSAWHGLDAAVKYEGRVFNAFTHAGGGKTLLYAVKDYTPDVATADKVSGVLVGHRFDDSRVTGVRVALKANLPYTASAAQEQFVLRLRHRPGIGGRADLAATGGDIPAGKIHLGFACWDTQEAEGFKVVRECTRPTSGQAVDWASCTQVLKQGVLANCKVGDNSAEKPEGVLIDASSTALEPDGPAKAEGLDALPTDLSGE